MKKRKRGFVLLEVMLGVAIFVIGILSIGASISNLLDADLVRVEDQRARQALENRMAEIQAGSVLVDKEKVDELKGMFSGMKLRQSRTPLKEQNEDGIDLLNLYEVTLVALWESAGEEQSKAISFYVYSNR